LTAERLVIHIVADEIRLCPFGMHILAENVLMVTLGGVLTTKLKEACLMLIGCIGGTRVRYHFAVEHECLMSALGLH
jgi:hypothetical protein